jgi:hypothetical protein
MLSKLEATNWRLSDIENKGQRGDYYLVEHQRTSVMKEN